MPHCKNDPNTNYKGSEPSPKGLGYCAHAQALGSKKTGLDGKQYQVRADKNGKKSWKLASTVPGGAKKSVNLPTVIIDAAVAGVQADSKIDTAVAAVSSAAKAQADATKAVTTAVKVAGPGAIDAIKQIQARLQTAKRSQIDEYLKAKKTQGLFTKPLKSKGYLLQNARADAIAIRDSFKKSGTQEELCLSQEDIDGIVDEFKTNMSRSKTIIPKMKKFLQSLRYEPGYVNAWGQKSRSDTQGKVPNYDDLYWQAISKVQDELKYGGDFSD